MSDMPSIARPTVSYPSEIMSNRNGYDLTRSFEPTSSVMPTSAAFERYDAAALSQRSNMYPYLQPTMDDLNHQQQKYLHEQHQMAAHAMLKAELETETSTPLYPRPMYHYDPSGPLPPGFSAINLSVKVAAAQAQAAAFKASASTPSGATSAPAPAIDLSTSSVNSSSPQGFNPTQYATERVNDSPRNISPNLGSSPVSSPTNDRSLDLSVNRLPHNGPGRLRAQKCLSLA